MAAKRKIISIHEKKKKGMTLGKFLYWMALLAFVGAIFYAFFFSGFLSTTDININGLEELDKTAVLENINANIIKEKYFGLLETNNLILIRSSKLKKELMIEFPKIKNVEIKKKFPGILIVNIQERQSAMLICVKADCYIIDKDGIAFSKKDDELPEIRENRLITLSDSGEKSISLGEQVFNADYLNYILNIGEEIKNSLDIDTTNNYETPSRVSSDIRANTSEGWKIYFNNNISLQKEIDMLQAVLNDKIGDKRQDLEYVDLRSDNKVYYKFRDGTQEEVNKDGSSNNQPAPAEEKKEGKKKKK